MRSFRVVMLSVMLIAEGVAGNRRAGARAAPDADVTGRVRHPEDRADGRPIDRAGHRFRYHAHRGDKPGCRGCRRRGATRGPDRRQIERNDQPDRLGLGAAAAVRPGRRAGYLQSAAAAPGIVPWRRHSSERERRGDRAVGTRVQQRHDAACRGNRRGRIVKSSRDQHAAAARRDGEPAGHAAGAVRRGEPDRAPPARRVDVHRGRGVPELRRAHDHRTIRGAELR